MPFLISKTTIAAATAAVATSQPAPQLQIIQQPVAYQQYCQYVPTVRQSLFSVENVLELRCVNMPLYYVQQ